MHDKSPNTKFLVQPQIHSWLKTLPNGSFTEFGLREMSNEEIQACAMIAISQGAEGLNWCNYHSQTSRNINEKYNMSHGLFGAERIDTIKYTIFGLRNDSTENLTKRDSNIIFQNKWNYVKAMNLKILHWKPALDRIKWDSGYSVHYEGATHNFISDIKSIYYDAVPPCAFSSGNNDPVKYWEMGFFNPDFENPDVSANDKSKYFIMVNRRCVPNENNQGDLRQLKIKFNSSQLSGFNNWKIIELDSNKLVGTFDKNAGAYVDMGIYQPGEGKLYKIAPVMQEGGTLVADEEVAPGTFN